MKISKGKRAHLLALCEDIADCHAEEARPYVCGGCYAIGGERCAEWCPDLAIECQREHDRETWEMYGDEEDRLSEWDEAAEDLCEHVEHGVSP